MEHRDYLIDLVDANGQVTGQKARSTVDKHADNYHAVHLIMLTPRAEVVLGRLPERHDLPNLYAHRLSTTVATIRRNQETSETAAARALKSELMIYSASIHPLGEGWLALGAGRGAYITACYLEAEAPAAYNTIDIAGLELMPADQLAEQLRQHPARFSLTLRAIWDSFGDQFPL